MAEREEGTAVPNQRQGENQQQNQQRQQNQDLAGQQQHLHINWSSFKSEFLGNQKKMQRHIYYAPMIG